ncbi:MAG: efflux RND transporter periplasmic adaptor subunit [Chloroflexota bacterium]|nr:efflux RND transporter periplasmic adaptor subunit [Chloroflexota bacterium]
MRLLGRINAKLAVGLLILILLIVAGVVMYPRLFNEGLGRPGAGDYSSNQNSSIEEPRAIRVIGVLMFPQTQELSFKTSGTVGQVSVSQGDKVVRGQLLVSLDDIAVSGLEEKLAKARSDVNDAQKALDQAREDFKITPLQQTALQDKIAKASKTLQTSQENLNDFQVDYEKDLSSAQKAKSDAESALNDAVESLEDYERTYEATLAKVTKAKIDAELALDNALESLEYQSNDQDHLIADARKTIATKQSALEAAQENLDNFDADFDESIADAVLSKTTAQTAFDTADDDRLHFYRFPTRDPEVGIVVDADAKAAVLAAYEETLTNLQQKKDELAELENNRDLDKEKTATAVVVAQVELDDANNVLVNLLDIVDQNLDLETRQAAVEVARATLSQAEIDWQDEIEGPDAIKLSILEAAVADAKAKLAQKTKEMEREQTGPDSVELELRERAVSLAQETFNDLVDGPDPYDVSLRESALVAKEAVANSIFDDLNGAEVIAPFDGIVALINVEVDDNVTKNSLVLEVTDPTAVQINAIVDASDISYIELGSIADVSVDSLPEQSLQGSVTYIDELARTERGVVSHNVVIKVDLPADTVIPVNLSAVTVDFRIN